MRLGDLVTCPRFHLSKDVLQSELHDSGIQGGIDLAEDVAVQDRGLIAFSNDAEFTAEAVGHVERFCAEFQPLAFANTEGARQRHVPRPRSDA